MTTLDAAPAPVRGDEAGGGSDRPVRRPRARLHAIDGLRLLAALMVALHHYTGTATANRTGTSAWERPARQIFPGLFRVSAYGWIGVEIFFVISGFVICMSCWGRRPRDFFVSRVIRLYPAYWAAVLLTTGVLAAWPVMNRALPADQVMLNLTMLQQPMGATLVDGVYWTLWSEMRFYLIFLLVVATGLTYRKVVVFCCVWGTLAVLAPASGLPFLVTLANPPAAWFFIAGLALFLIHRFGPDLLLWSILGMSWLMGQHELADRVAYERVSSWRGAAVVYTVFLAVMLLIASGRTDWVRGRWLTVAGALTYPFYLIHYSAGLTAIRLLHDRVDARLLLVGLVGTALLLAWLIHRLVERPLSRLMKKGLVATFTRLEAG